ncbi:MAG: prenyltransferase [Deltaproteobacteria bacterium]|nr:prenyltransferase [Deltaproteobacteria bacterium]
MNKLQAWLLASRPASQTYIFFPLLLGQAVHYSRTGWIDWSVFVLLHLYGLFLQLFIVYANDRADIETDRLNTTYTVFSGGSRTLVNGLISLQENYAAVLYTVALNVMVGIFLTAVCGRALALPFIGLSLGLLWMYSFSPVRLSYRGGGELLQMFGVGLVLPVFGYYGQAGDAARFEWALLAFILPGQLACAMATALPDEPSDRASGKHTSAVLLGPGAAKLVIIILNAAAIVFFLLLMEVSPGSRLAATAVPSLCVAGMLALRTGAVPGTQHLALFVTCAIGSTVLLTAATAFLLFAG